MCKNGKRLNGMAILSALLLITAITACDISGSGEYFTVSFAANGGVPEPPVLKVKKGSKLEIPDGFEKSGFDFSGWYKDSACTVLWDFENDIVTGDIMLYAKWEPQKSDSAWDGGGFRGGGVVPIPIPTPAISSWQELKAKIETTGITTETIPLDPAGNWAADDTITVATGQEITLTAASTVTITRDSGASFDANFFQVDGTLKLGTAGMAGSIILDGAVAPNANDPIIYVDGTLEMNSSVTLRKNINPVSGGAVYIFAGGKFAMNGGEISQNESQNDGGAVHLSGTSAVNYAEFTMTGGSIIGNKAQNGGGVISYYGKFKMSGGSISGNETTSALGDGGGVYVYDSTFDMDGGDIYGNKAYRGGGVYNFMGDFNMNGGNVHDNEALQGGGVAIGSFSGNFNMANNAAIKDNLAGSIVSPSGGQGGGVWIDNGGTFVMSGGVISGNRAVYAFGSGDGGGVYLEDPASLTKTGGTIHGVNPASLSPLADPCTEDSDSNMIVDGGSGAFLPVIIYGHAVYSDSPSQRRVSTAGSTMGTGNPQFWLE